MAKAVLISIQPKWCEKIMSGEKTVEVRKSRPKLKTPFRCYVYCTHGTGANTLNIPISKERLLSDCAINGMRSMNCPIGNGKVIGEFVCDEGFVDTEMDFVLTGVTHWMPLPEPPEEVLKGGEGE